MDQAAPLRISPEKRFLIVSAWAAMLLISDLPDVLWKAVFGQVPGWLFWIKVGLLALFFGLCLVWKGIRPLRQLAFIMLVFYLAFAASTWIGSTPWWKGRFAGAQPTFTLTYLGALIRDVGVAFAVVAGLWLIKRHWKNSRLVNQRGFFWIGALLVRLAARSRRFLDDRLFGVVVGKKEVIFS